MLCLLVFFVRGILEVDPTLFTVFQALASMISALGTLGVFLPLVTSEGTFGLVPFVTEWTIKSISIFHGLVFDFTNAMSEMLSSTALHLLRPNVCRSWSFFKLSLPCSCLLFQLTIFFF